MDTKNANKTIMQCCVIDPFTTSYRLLIMLSMTYSYTLSYKRENLFWQIKTNGHKTNKTNKNFEMTNE